MSDLRLICRRCAKETPASACDKTGLCVICITTDDVQVDKAEYERLWKKYVRYRANPKMRSLQNLEKQIARVARRLGDKVHARIANGAVAVPIINAHLEEVRNRVEHPGLKRIHLPQTGDMLRSRLASA